MNNEDRYEVGLVCTVLIGIILSVGYYTKLKIKNYVDFKCREAVGMVDRAGRVR